MIEYVNNRIEEFPLRRIRIASQEGATRLSNLLRSNDMLNILIREYGSNVLRSVPEEEEMKRHVSYSIYSIFFRRILIVVEKGGNVHLMGNKERVLKVIYGYFKNEKGDVPVKVQEIMSNIMVTPRPSRAGMDFVGYRRFCLVNKVFREVLSFAPYRR